MVNKIVKNEEKKLRKKNHFFVFHQENSGKLSCIIIASIFQSWRFSKPMYRSWWWRLAMDGDELIHFSMIISARPARRADGEGLQKFRWFFFRISRWCLKKFSFVLHRFESKIYNSVIRILFYVWTFFICNSGRVLVFKFIY